MFSIHPLTGRITLGVIFFLAATGSTFGQPRSAFSTANLKTGPSLLAAFKQVSREVRDSVVSLSLDGTNALSLGTIVDADGLVISKSSELRATQLKAKLFNSNVVKATVLLRDAENDVALIKLEAKNLKPIEWASEFAKPGQWAVTQGIDPEPEAVGIVSTPSRRLSARAYLGIGASDGMTNGKPVRIGSVTPGFGAEQAGLRQGDIILAINGGVVQDWNELVSDLRLVRPGDSVRVRAQREGREFEADARVLPSQDPPGARSMRVGLTQTQQAAVAAMNDSLASLIQAAAGARAALSPTNLYLQPMNSAGIQSRVEALRLAELEFASARAEESAKFRELGIDLGVIQNPGRTAPANLTDGQQAAVTSMMARLLPLVQAANAARIALSPSELFTQAMDLALVPEKVEALRIAELALAEARVKAMERLQASRAQIFPEQLPVLIQQSLATGRGGRGAIPDRQTIMSSMGTERSVRRDDFELVIQHDTVLEPAQCGGPLVNLQGEAIGLNIAREGRIASYALPAELVMRLIDDMKEDAGL